MEFWPEFMASSWGREFVAGGFGGAAGIISGYPLDTLRIRQQQCRSPASAVSILRRMVCLEGPTSLYRGMSAPLASVCFQNAMVFQTYAMLSRCLDSDSDSSSVPPSYTGVALGGIGTGALQSLLLTPVELIKIRLQSNSNNNSHPTRPIALATTILSTQGLKGLYRGLTITVLRDAPAHGLYFWTYEYVRESLHPGCRHTGDETLSTMLLSGGLAGVASWVSCYPLDVIKTRLQAQPHNTPYHGILHCFRTSVRDEGYLVLWRGLGTAVARAFVVNGAIFAAYEIALRCLFNNGN